MKEPERLFASDPELARIRAMLERDGPPEGALDRAARRVLASPTIASSASLATVTSRSASSKLWIVVGLGVLVATGAAVVTRAQSSGEGASTPSAVFEGAAPTPGAPGASANEAPANEAPTVGAAATMRVEDLPTASPAGSAPPMAAPPASKAAAHDPFVEELALVEQARAALAKGHGRECLEAVTSYEKRFANGGLFVEEVEVMHIEGLAMSGDHVQARARGTRFLAGHRQTPYGERVRRVLEQAAP
jgi:hypothetical protein